MPSTSFTDYSTVVPAAWLNEVNGVVWTLFGAATTAGDGRTALGLGTISTQAASNVAITGGSITGITDLAIADGGTGASDAATARTNLGLGTLATIASPLPIANGGTGQITAALGFDALKQAATTSATGVVELATSAEVQTGTSTTLVPSVSSMQAGKIVQGTSTATTSGTTIDFTSAIPSWAKRVTVVFSQVSANGSSSFLVRLGAGGTYENTGYKSICVGAGGGTAETSTAGFLITKGNAAGGDTSGILTLVNQTGNTWVCSSAVGYYTGVNAGDCYATGGTKTLSGVLDSVRLMAVNGTDTFDAGSMNITWE